MKHLGFYWNKEDAIADYGDKIEWYTNPHPTQRFGNDCFYCGTKETGFMSLPCGYLVTQYHPNDIVAKKVCEGCAKYIGVPIISKGKVNTSGAR